MTRRIPIGLGLAALVAATATLLALLVLPADAATFTVNETDDALSDGTCDATCTLRDAVEAADAAGVGPHEIIVPAGTHTLTVTGLSYTNAAALTITGAGIGVTRVEIVTGICGFDGVFNNRFCFRSGCTDGHVHRSQ